MAKASTAWTVIPQAEATGNCEVRAESYVSRIETDKRGRVTGAAYFDAEGKEHFQRARAVVLAANGGETPRLLLNSAGPKFPQGLGNSSGLVGKYLMFNYTARVNALFEHELNEYKSVQVTRILHDFYDSDPKRGFYGGGGLDCRIGPQPAFWAIRTASDGPAWGKGYKERLREFPRSMQVSCHTTSLALESNNITIDPTLKDAWGIPVIAVRHADRGDAPGILERGIDGDVVGFQRKRGGVAGHLHRAREFPQAFLVALSPGRSVARGADRPERGLWADAAVESAAAIEAALRIRIVEVVQDRVT